MHKLITAMEPLRDQRGYWTHPNYFVPTNGMEYAAPGEFEAWLEAHRLVGDLRWMEEDATDDQLASFEAGDGNISQWNPTPPTGEGWFVGSIHDTEEGPICYWLRPIENDPIALKDHFDKSHVEALKIEFLRLHQACTKAAYAYFCACDLGEERITAHNIHERIRLAIRTGGFQ
ncbi:hypothetical protein [Serratia fonticola]